MSNFQLAALAFFGLVLFVTYKETILASAKALVTNLRKKMPQPTPQSKEPSRSALDFVNDLLLVRDLRSRLNACDCCEGVDACTILLRVMIESDYEKTEG
jgi:hypothetical protein